MVAIEASITLRPPYTGLTCPELPPLPNGMIVYNNMLPPFIGSTATYTCVPGFELVGGAVRVCQDDNTFNGSAPTCRIIGGCDLH